MLELLVIGAVGVGLALLVIVPLLLMKAALGLLFGLIALPFKLLAGLFKIGGALLGGVVGLAGVLFGGILALACVALCLPLLLLAVPLIPLLVVGAGTLLLLKGGLAVLA